MGPRKRIARSTYVAAIVAFAGLVAAPVAAASSRPVTWIDGAHPSGTPAKLDRVGVLKVGPKRARNVLVLVTGQNSDAGARAPLARTLVGDLPGWQVWTVERRENLLEDQSVLDRAKRGAATPQKVFDYYLRWTTDSTVTDHVRPVQDARFGFARHWGMRVAVKDLHHVVKAAARGGRRVVLGGHSLGGPIATAYATWDFDGRPGVDDLSGLVFVEAASQDLVRTAAAARQQLQDLRTSSPWLAGGGYPAPLGSLFMDVGAALVKMDPEGPSLLQGWSGWPIRPPVPLTNEAAFGFALDTETSPSSLVTLQVHAGHLAASGDPRPWVRDGEITPIQRYASAVSGWGLRGTDGTAWYHPQRLTSDSLAVDNGNPSPAQRVLGLKATHGDDIDVPIYAFGASYFDGAALDAARKLARQSHLPKRKLTLVDRSRTYTHGDPNLAFPHNAFVAHLVPFLKRIAKR